MVGDDGRLVPLAHQAAPTLCEVCRGTTRAALAAYLAAGWGDDDLRDKVAAVLRELTAGDD